MVNPKKCFVNARCSFDCPNAQIDYIDYVYGSGIASDMGLEIVKCKYCDLNTFLCADCLLFNTPYCPDSVLGVLYND